MRHASSCGALVIEGVSVTSLNFRDLRNNEISGTLEDLEVASATWSSGSDSGTTTFDWLVDASGRSGILSTKYLKSRKFNKSLRNIAMWGYWTEASVYMPGTDRENAPWFEALIGMMWRSER